MCKQKIFGQQLKGWCNHKQRTKADKGRLEKKDQDIENGFLALENQKMGEIWTSTPIQGLTSSRSFGCRIHGGIWKRIQLKLKRLESKSCKLRSLERERGACQSGVS